jgi:hypothetical protein
MFRLMLEDRTLRRLLFWLAILAALFAGEHNFFMGP